jgi:catechol 2,3-dioxygenase-like lactoylglutathione lyase family enzyme
MPVRVHHIVIDARDLPGLARFWTRAPGWKVLSERENEVVIGLTKTRLPACASCRSPSPRCSRTACTFDLTSSAADRDQEIDRLRVLGARPVDIGQAGAESWTVLADPEGNEF